MTERDVIAGVLGPHCGIDSDWCSCTPAGESIYMETR